MLFSVNLIHQWDARGIAFWSLILLAICPFLLLYQQGDFVEQIAMYAYYFLMIMVVLQIIELWRESKEQHAQ